jgi:putative ABC transport system substrate-binding protein
MNRRQLLALLGGSAVARPRLVQSADRMRRVGVLIPLTEPAGRDRVAAFREQLQKLGWSGADNIEIDVRWSDGDAKLAEQYALELAALAPDVVVLQSSQGVPALQAANPTLPVVMAFAGDLVERGIVESLAHPGGNITGLTFAESSIGGKWLELLKATAPRLTRVLNIHSPSFDVFLPAIRTSAAALGVEVLAAPVWNASDVTEAIERFAQEADGGLILHPYARSRGDGVLMIALAARYGLPAIYPYGNFVRGGGLMSYGINWNERFRSAAGYVDLILRGARPADLPVQSATKIELVINLKTAKALGLTVPPRLLARADVVIE